MLFLNKKIIKLMTASAMLAGLAAGSAEVISQTMQPVTVSAAQVNTKSFTAVLPKTHIKAKVHQRITFPITITNKSKSTQSFNVAPINAITTKALDTTYSSAEPVPNAPYLSTFLVNENASIAPGKSKTLYFRMELAAPTTIMGAFSISAAHSNKTKILPVLVHIGKKQALQAQITNANFVKRGQITALKEDFNTNGVYIKNAKITSTLSLKGKTISKTSTSGRNLAPNSAFSLYINVNQALKPGNYQLSTTITNGVQSQVINTPLPLTKIQLQKQNDMINNSVAKLKHQRHVKFTIISVIVIALSALAGALIAKFMNKKNGGSGNTDNSSTPSTPDNSSPEKPDKLSDRKSWKNKSIFSLKKKNKEMPESFNADDQSDQTLKSLQDTSTPETTQHEDNTTISVNEMDSILGKENDAKPDQPVPTDFKPNYKPVPKVHENEDEFAKQSVIVDDKKEEKPKEKSAAIELGTDDDKQTEDHQDNQATVDETLKDLDDLMK